MSMQEIRAQLIEGIGEEGRVAATMQSAQDAAESGYNAMTALGLMIEEGIDAGGFDTASGHIEKADTGIHDLNRLGAVAIEAAGKAKGFIAPALEGAGEGTEGARARKKVVNQEESIGEAVSMTDETQAMVGTLRQQLTHLRVDPELVTDAAAGFAVMMDGSHSEVQNAQMIAQAAQAYADTL